MRHSLHGEVHASLIELLKCLMVECQAVRAAVVSGRQRGQLVGGPGGVQEASEAAEALLFATQVIIPSYASFGGRKALVVTSALGKHSVEFGMTRCSLYLGD